MTSSTSVPADAPPKAQRSSFPGFFWVANTMEIFERMAWYGFFTVSSLYITGAVAEGGLGFTSEQRGTLQGIITFILYLLPVLTGALADRFGYKKTFLLAYAVMVPAYLLLGQLKTYETFFFAFLLVAFGAALFKPVVVGSVARATNSTNSSLGFGIFYMMVNVGGLVGAILAGILRSWSWHFVFLASALWIALNFIWVTTLYREPTLEAASAAKRTVKKVLSDMVEVLGNVRFFITVFVILIALMLASSRFFIARPNADRIEQTLREALPTTAPPSPGQIAGAVDSLKICGIAVPADSLSRLLLPDPPAESLPTMERLPLVAEHLRANFAFPSDGLIWRYTLLGILAWIALNLLLDVRLRRRNTEGLLQPMKLGNWRFALYLLILSGFWTSFNQVFLTMPEYIRDFVNTGDMLGSVGGIFQIISPLKIENIVRLLGDHVPDLGALLSTAQLQQLHEALLSARINLPQEQINVILGGITAVGHPVTSAQLTVAAQQLIDQGRQVNPEYLIKFDAGSIVVFQLLITWLIARWRPFNAMIGGILVASIGLALAAFMHQGWPVVIAIVVFAFGEMMASPKSQEYIGLIAPSHQKALYMGYYFWAVALGNLFGGLLSGQLYGWLARDLQRPDIMWFIFGALGLLTALALVAYDRLVIRKMKGDVGMG